MRKIPLLLTILTALPLSGLATASQSITLDVQSMTCSVCPITVKKALQAVPGVSDVSIDFEQKTAKVTFDPHKAKPTDLTTATTNAGFPSVVHQ